MTIAEDDLDSIPATFLRSYVYCANARNCGEKGKFMRTRHYYCATVAICLFCQVPITHCKLLENWPYTKLVSESDIVAIATPIESQPHEAKIELGIKESQLTLKGVVTTFKILSCLKGTKEGELKLLHYRLESTDPVLMNPPVTLDFVTIKEKKGTKEKERRSSEYLLFLKKGNDNLFELVSGSDQPQLSVKEINKPTNIEK